MSIENQLEPLLDSKKQRFTLFPIDPEYKDIWQSYKGQQASFWTAEEIDLSKDRNDWENKLNADEKFFIKHILAFFAGSDGIVNMNLLERFTTDVKILEAQTTYAYQAYIEGVHSETYSLLIDTYISDPKEKEKLFNAIETIPCIKKKADWALNWIKCDELFSKRLIAFAIVEGIFFSGAFCSIYWLKNRGLMPGLCKANEFIARDEGMHTDFACELYQLIVNKPDKNEVYNIIKESVDIAKNFSTESIKCKLVGLNSELMNQYIEYVADRLSIALGYEKIYKVNNPFTFMDSIGMLQKTNFHEQRPTEYQSAYNNTEKSLEIEDDF